jgi:hypothetical protein
MTYELLVDISYLPARPVSILRRQMTVPSRVEWFSLLQLLYVSTLMPAGIGAVRLHPRH